VQKPCAPQLRLLETSDFKRLLSLIALRDITPRFGRNTDCQANNNSADHIGGYARAGADQR